MAVRVYWLDEAKTLLNYEFVGDWTWEEFYPVLEEAHAMSYSVSHRVDAICDFRSTTALPQNALANLKTITDKAPVNSGLSVFVTTSRFFTSMYDTAVKFYPKTRRYFVVAATMEEAHAIINEDRMKESGQQS
jgi:hypothetical protein